jgi:hypothetical protein
MKRSSFLITAASLLGSVLIAGCQNQGADLTSPDETLSTPTPVIIELSTDEELAKRLHAEEEITVADGGKLELSFTDKKGLSVYMKLEFEPGSVSNDFKATLKTDTKYLTTDMALTFGPHGTSFLKPAKLTMWVTGLDLENFKKYDCNRDGVAYLSLYYTSDGKWDRMQGSLKLDLNNGTIHCSGVELPHFSRYAFGT